MNVFIGSMIDQCFPSFLYFVPVFLFRRPNTGKAEQWQLILLRNPAFPGSQTKNKPPKLRRK